MRYRHTIAVTAALVVSVSLGGCGALLGGGKPAQLYRFGTPLASAPKDSSGVIPPVRQTLLLMPVRFAAEIEGDRVLASRDNETLYIKGLRWVAPAPSLFDQSVRAAFHTRAPWVAVTDRRTSNQAAYVLQIRVVRFEARYAAGVKVPPTIHVEGEATVEDARSHSSIGSYRFNAEQQADGRNAAAIVAAFDQADAAATIATVDWASVLLATR